MDGNKQVHICFLPESKYDSGGVAASLTSLGFLPNGEFDIKQERKLDRDIARGHYAATFRYFTWYFKPPTTPMPRSEKKSSKSQRIEQARKEKALRNKSAGFAW